MTTGSSARGPAAAAALGLSLLLASCAHARPAVPAARAAARVPITSEGPLLLQGDEVLAIVDSHFVQHGGIVLRDRARLVIRGSVFEHRHQYSFQHTLEAYDDARVEIVDSRLVSSPWLNWNFHGRSSLLERDVDATDSQIWHYFPEASRADFVRAAFRGTLDGSARARIAHVPGAQIELVLPEGLTLDTSFPAHAARYVFPPESHLSIPLRLEIEESPIEFWGVTVQPRSNVTIRDTHGVVVTVSATPAWDHETVELQGLAREHYADRVWELPQGARLRLVNTWAAGWSPVAFADNTLIVRDSVLNDQAFSGGRATILFERVSTSFVRAREDVRIVLRDSVVEGDVVAQDNGRIELVRTRVGGRRVTEGQGQIVDDPRP